MNSLQACVLTAVGRGAIATVAVRGEQPLRVIEQFFQPFAGKLDDTANRVRFGNWIRHEKTETTTQQESVVLCFTRRDEVEIHCHGGRAAVSALMDDLVAAGAQRVEASEWIIDPKASSLNNECTHVLSHVQTETAAAIVMDQIRGALESEVTSIRQHLRDGNTQEATGRLQVLIDRFGIGRHVVDPFQVVIAGPPNVGKSSLLNVLLGFDRAITFNQPGTTRDVVSATTALGGWLIHLSDTAGIRETAESIEKEGVRRALERIKSADLILHVIDSSSETAIRDSYDLSDRPHLQIWNKIDLLEPSKREHLPNTALAVSATSGEGIDLLIAKVCETLVPDLPEPGSPVPITHRQNTLLSKALAEIESPQADDFLDSLLHPQVPSFESEDR